MGVGCSRFKDKFDAIDVDSVGFDVDQKVVEKLHEKIKFVCCWENWCPSQERRETQPVHSCISEEQEGCPLPQAVWWNICWKCVWICWEYSAGLDDDRIRMRNKVKVLMRLTNKSETVVFLWKHL